MSNKKTIIGSGLAGPLLAILLAKRGYSIDLFEKRADLRLESVSAGRSINLALSYRGIEALKSASIFEMSIKNWLDFKLSESKIIDFVTPKNLREKKLNL